MIRFLHKLSLTSKDVKKYTQNNILFEVDLSFDDKTQKPYVGHPTTSIGRSFIPFPPKISFDELVSYLEQNKNACIMFDCKNKKVLSHLKKLIDRIDTKRVIFHAFVLEWAKKYFIDCPKKEYLRNECISIKEIEKFQKETNTFWLGTILAPDPGWLRKNNVLNRALKDSRGIFKGIGIFFSYLHLPFPSLILARIISKSGYLPIIPDDLLIKRPNFPYIGTTIFSWRATNLD